MNHRLVRFLVAFFAATFVALAFLVILGPVGAREIVIGFAGVIGFAVAAAWWPGRRRRAIP